LLPKLSAADSIEILRDRLPGGLVCTTCARLIASASAGYAKSNLTPEQVEHYVCHGCRLDADPARSTEVTARFAAAKAAAAAARLRAPLTGILAGTKRPNASGNASQTARLDAQCICSPVMTCASCLQTLASEASDGRRVAHDYLATCATNGQHDDLDARAECPHPNATVAPVATSPTFCEHARPAEACIVHAKRGTSAPMPVALARCESCGGWHGKNGRDRCPYGRQEAAAVRTSRMPGAATYSKKPPVAKIGARGDKKINDLQDTIPHLANAAKRLRRKPGRRATGVSKWAGLRRKQRGDAA
jgi:hypothetical protein